MQRNDVMHLADLLVFCISISQGSVAMHLRCDGKFKNSFIANFQQIATLEEFYRSTTACVCD